MPDTRQPDLKRLATSAGYDLTVSVLDRDTGQPVATSSGLDAAGADQFIQGVYRANPGCALTARVELDLDDTCLEW